MEYRADVTQLIAANLHAMPHQDGKPRRFMAFSQFGKDEKTAAAVAILAKEHGESIQELLGRNGYEIVHKDDVHPADAPGFKKVKVKRMDGKWLYDLGCDHNLNAELSNIAVRNLITNVFSLPEYRDLIRQLVSELEAP